MSDVTRILSEIEQGDPSAAEQLLPLVYDELRKLAAAKLATRSRGRRSRPRPWSTRRTSGWWMPTGAALGQPRPLLRRGGRGHAADPGRSAPAQSDSEGAAVAGTASTSTDAEVVGPATPGRLLALDEALSSWQARTAAVAAAGQAPLLRGLSHRGGRRSPRHLGATAYRHWAYARAWLLRVMAAANSAWPVR